jgi:hypothetical protein
MSASLVTPIFFERGKTFSSVSLAGFILEVPFTVHFILLASSILGTN